MTDAEIDALEAAARAATHPGPPSDVDAVWIDDTCFVNVVADAVCGRADDAYYRCHNMKATPRLRMRTAYRAFLDTANPAAILALIQRVREAERIAIDIAMETLTEEGPDWTEDALWKMRRRIAAISRDEFLAVSLTMVLAACPSTPPQRPQNRKRPPALARGVLSQGPLKTTSFPYPTRQGKGSGFAFLTPRWGDFLR